MALLGYIGTQSVYFVFKKAVYAAPLRDDHCRSLMPKQR